MKYTRQLLLVATTIATAGLFGCGGGDETTINYTATSTVTNGGTNGGGGNVADCPTWAPGVVIQSQVVCQLPAEVLEDRTLTEDNIWYLAAQVRVGNGNEDMSVTPGILASGANVLNVTLTIEPGTQIWGRAFSPASNTVGNLIITRGSQIQAVGTAAAPIVFSSPDADFVGAGEWGGLILHGYGVHNVCPPFAPGPCNVDSEGNSGKSGGYNDADSSGRLEYVIVTEGGAEFSTGNEINGISFVAVGSGTQIDFIQVNGNSDDGLEFYGGAVNAKHIVLTGNRDDSVDWDEGWQGNLQFVLVIQEDANTTQGNAIEADSEGNVINGDFSTPTIANATFIGGGEQDDLWRFKESTGGFLLNSLGVYSNPTQFPSGAPKTTTCADVVDLGSENNIGTGLLDFNNVIIGCAVFGNARASGLMDTTTLMVDPQLDTNYASQAPEASGVPLDVAGFKLGNSAAASTDVGFFTDTNYIGAIDPAAATAWFEGWTLDGSL